MCDKWSKSYHKEQYGCNGVTINKGSGDYTVKGQVTSKTSNPTIVFWAANPPTYNNSFTGSGLPYPDPKSAYENSVNKGAVVAKNGEFEFKIHYPNSYYTGLGTVLVHPHVNFKVCEPGSRDKVYRINLGESIPFRTLTYPQQRKSPAFYERNSALPVLSQEQILRNSAYPKRNHTPGNFWGKVPPH